MSEEQSSWGMLVAFPDGSASFVNGFEAGQIWEAITRGDVVIERMIHTENEEVIRRMAIAKGYAMERRWTIVPEWSDVTLTLDNTAPLAKANPHGLRVVP